MEDSKIVQLYWQRDEQAVRETQAAYGRLCYGIAYNILNSHEDAEECVNDAYVAVWNAIPPAKPDCFMAFLCKIVRNCSLKRLAYLTRQKRSAALTESFEELAEVLSQERVATDEDEKEIGKLISCFLRTQKQEVRLVFVRKYFFFDSIEAIAKRCSFSESKVKNMLFRSRKRLREYLKKEGVLI